MAAAPSASASGHQQAVKKKLTMMNLKVVEDKDDDMPLVFRRVMAAAASSSSLVTTIGEDNKIKNIPRASAWILFVFLPSAFLATAAGLAYIMYDDRHIRRSGFPWCLPVTMLWGVYMAVLQLAMWYLVLFLPEAPFAAWEALWNVGYEKIGIAVSLISVPVLLFDLTCMLWSCVVGVLIAAVLAFWICLVRRYGNPASGGKRGLAIGLAVSSLLTAAMLAFMIHTVRPGLKLAREA